MQTAEPQVAKQGNIPVACRRVSRRMGQIECLGVLSAAPCAQAVKAAELQAMRDGRKVLVGRIKNMTGGT